MENKMKKATLYYTVFAALLLSGCAGDNYNSGYNSSYNNSYQSSNDRKINKVIDEEMNSLSKKDIEQLNKLK
jgi:outer membrane lipoprotein SlyB